MSFSSIVVLSVLTRTHHTAASFQVTLVLNLETSSLHGPVLMWHGTLDIMKHQEVSISQIYSSCSRKKRKWSVLVTFWNDNYNNNNTKTVTEIGCGLAALTGGWNHDSDALDGCNIRKVFSFRVVFLFHCSGEAFVGIMILESICWIRGTGEKTKSKQLNMFLCPHSLKVF